MHEIVVILQLIGVLLLTMYIVGPVAVKFNVRIRTTRAPVVVEVEVLSPEAKAHFEESDGPLRELGFERVALLCHDGLVKGIRSYFAQYTHTGHGQVAQVSVIHANMRIKGSLEFSTVSADGIIVDTSNAKIVPTFKPVEHKKVLRAPFIEDIRVLYRLHLAREARYLKPTAERFLPAPGTEAEVSALAVSMDLLWQANAGFVRRGTQPGVYVLTWTGALLMSWKQLFPVHQILAWQQRRRVLRELSDAMRTPVTPSAPARISHRVPFQISEGFPVTVVPTASTVQRAPGQQS